MRASESLGDLFEYQHQQQNQKFETVKIKLHEFDPRLTFKAIVNPRPRTGQADQTAPSPAPARSAPSQTVVASPSRGGPASYRQAGAFTPDHQFERVPVAPAKPPKPQSQNLEQLVAKQQRGPTSLQKRKSSGNGSKKRGASPGHTSKEIPAVSSGNNIDGMFSQTQQRMLFLKNFRQAQQSPVPMASLSGALQRLRHGKGSVRLKHTLPVDSATNPQVQQQPQSRAAQNQQLYQQRTE